jgi:hypothetical protein
MSDFALSIVLGIAPAAAHGFRVFLPMLIVGGAAYTGHLSLDNSFAWLDTPSALTILSVAALAEVLAYCVPVVDNTSRIRCRDGFHYVVLKLGDGSFLHFFEAEDSASPMAEIEAFRLFQAGVRTTARIVRPKK